MLGGDSSLKIIINAKDNASKAIRGVGAQAKKTADNMKGYGAGLTVMGAGITAVMGKSVKAYQAQEFAEKRLEAISKKVTGSTEAEIEAFKKLATELQSVGVVGDEVLIMGQSQLASFTKSSEVVTELSDDLADLAVGQYGVNVSQEQAIQTANLMGKALSGQLGALTRTGILVSEELKVAFEECNTEEERAIVLSQIIQDNYGGLNEEMRKTSAGGMQDVINSFGDMQEEIGEKLIPILMGLMEKIKPIIENTMKWMEENEELTGKIIIVVAAIGGLMLVLGPLLLILPGLISAVTLLMGAFGLILSPIGLVVLAIGAAIIIGKQLIDNWEVVKESLKIIWEAIKTEADTTFEAIKTVIMKWIDPIIEAINNLLSKIESAKRAVSAGWERTTTGGLGGLKEDIGTIFGKEHGGIVQGAIGQAVPIIAHGQETIIPAGHKASGGGNTINIYNPIVRNDNDIIKIRQEINKCFRGLIVNNKITA